MSTAEIISFSEKPSELHCLICDDEPAFCQNISKSITDWFSSHGIHSECTVFDDPVCALNAPDIEHFQIAFLDVEMSPLNGIELGKQLKRKNKNIVIIYVSAFLEFALDGYSVSAFRYILKRDLELLLPTCLTAALKELTPESHFFTIKSNNTICKIDYDDIYYFQSDLRKIHIFGNTSNECLGSFYNKLSSIVPQLEPFGFLQIGRSYLVNMLHIKQIVHYTVLLDNDMVLNTSRSNYSAIQQKYLDWKGAF